jgi:UDP-N-acetylglucosamine 4,6-dehydratase
VIYFITGITGFLGRALTQALLADPNTKRIVGISRDEHKAAACEKHFSDSRLEIRIGDVRDKARLRKAMSLAKRPDVVIHAAAMKRVEWCEREPEEAYKTNVEGTRNVVAAAQRARIGKVVVVSSDKAASAETCYGKTKAMAEEVALDANAYNQRTNVSVVRYGNVMDSTGAFFHTLMKARATGEPVTITDPEATRFFWCVEDAVAFVRRVIARMSGAEIWVPKLASTTIAEYARAFAPRSEQIVSGMRGIEKRHELMISEAESRCAYELPFCYVLLPKRGQWWSPEPPAGAVPVPSGFTYGSGDDPLPVHVEVQETQSCALPS